MSFHAPPSPPVLTRKQLKSINTNLKSMVEALRGPHARYRERVLLGELKGSRFMVFSAIVSRTLGWKNTVDVITLNQFERGFPAISGKGQAWVGGLPKFGGTGLSRKTIINGLAGLEKAGIIARFRVPDADHGEIHAFAPMSVWTICEAMTARRGLPPPWLKEMVQIDLSGKPKVTALERAFTAYLNRPPGAVDNDDQEASEQDK